MASSFKGEDCLENIVRGDARYRYLSLSSVCVLIMLIIYVSQKPHEALNLLITEER
jgi:hypothetical protein